MRKGAFQIDLDALTQQAAARLLSTTARSLRDWEASGEAVPRNPDGTYPGPALVAWYSERGGETLDANKERARKDKEMADKLALQNAATRRAFGVVAHVADWYGEHVERCCTRLEEIADGLGQIGADARIVAECRRLVHEARAELAADTPTGGASDIGEVEAAADADGEPVGGLGAEAIEREQRVARTVAN